MSKPDYVFLFLDFRTGMKRRITAIKISFEIIALLCQYQAWQRLRILDLALIVGSYSTIVLAIVDIKLIVGRLKLRYNVFIVRNRLTEWTIASVT